MRDIMATASTGYSPAAVSAESMTASVPSKIAFATSEASARVGAGAVTIGNAAGANSNNVIVTDAGSSLNSALLTVGTSGSTGNVLAVNSGGLVLPTGITVTSQETDNLCIEALAAGRSWDFFVQGKEFIQNAIDKGAKIKFLDNKWITAEQISIALDKAGLPTASMLAALNKIVADAHADGTLTAISKKWLNGVDVTVKQ